MLTRTVNANGSETYEGIATKYELQSLQKRMRGWQLFIDTHIKINDNQDYVKLIYVKKVKK